ncbi:hypothetical protein AKJ16_DCAP20530 [Drosera capensis]
MAVPWKVSIWIAKMVWLALASWVSSCLIVADDIASSLPSGDIGAFYVGLSRCCPDSGSDHEIMCKLMLIDHRDSSPLQYVSVASINTSFVS